MTQILSDPHLKKRAQHALQDDVLRKAVRFTADRLRGRKREVTDVLGQWEEWRTTAREVRLRTLAHLDTHLDTFTRNVEAAGGHVHYASDAAEAQEIFKRIAAEKNAHLVAKSKSMVSEEVHINHVMADEGVECVETDLGEWIVQLAHETPSHIIIPAIHKNRYQVQELFEEHSGETLAPETPVLAGYARRALRDTFCRADIGMTGCNFAIAESGSVVIFSNEGNGRMVSSLPKTHIVMMGMERILPTFADLEVMANMLPRSATGQKTTVYVSAITGPRRPMEVDGPDEVHIILLDNGRSKVLADPEFREVLNCIRCGACLNVCPVYRQIGGHAYGSVYSGPIGAVISPLLSPDDPVASELPYASSLCGACSEACPVKIPLHDMLVHLRRRNVEAGRTPLGERLAYKAFGVTAGSPGLFKTAGAAAHWLQLNVLQSGDPKKPMAPTVRSAVDASPVGGWSQSRDLPNAPKESFRDLWRRGRGGQNEGPGAKGEVSK